jgi:hypothetical protein
LGPAALAQAVEVLREAGQITEYCPVGIPHPEFVVASIKAPPRILPDLIRDLSSIEGIRLRDLGVFPYGVPVGDEVLIRVYLSGPNGR